MTYTTKSPLTKTSGHYGADQLWAVFEPMTPPDQAYSNDGSGGGTITNTGVSATGTGIAQELRCICDGSGVTFLIGGVPVARHTTNLPAGSTNLRPMATATSLAASTSRAVRVGRITVESKP